MNVTITTKARARAILLKQFNLNMQWHADAHLWAVRLMANGLHVHAARMQVNAAVAHACAEQARDMYIINEGLG
jgi:hypothetical protein